MGHPELKTIATVELERDVGLAQKGDEQALSRLVTHTKDRLFRFLFFLCGDTHLAHDLTQDTYVYALENLGKLREPRAFIRWLFLIARNRFLDHRRSPRNQPTDPVESLDTATPAGDSDRELAFQTREVLSLLKEEDRVVLILVDMEGHAYSEAAEIIGISEGAVRSRLHRARAAFHALFFRS